MEINSLSTRTKGAAVGTASNWAFNFMVVEITPVGIQSPHWKFYIIWIILNAAFVSTVYLFYPETPDRTLEDVDRLFRENHDIFVFQDKDAIAPKRPQKYVEYEHEEVRRNSSVAPGMLRRASGISAEGRMWRFTQASSGTDSTKMGTDTKEWRAGKV